LTPFMGVGSEVYSAVKMGRKAIGIELKPTYYNQAVKNLTQIKDEAKTEEFNFSPQRTSQILPNGSPGGVHLMIQDKMWEDKS